MLGSGIRQKGADPCLKPRKAGELCTSSDFQSFGKLGIMKHPHWVFYTIIMHISVNFWNKFLWIDRTIGFKYLYRYFLHLFDWDGGQNLTNGLCGHYIVWRVVLVWNNMIFAMGHRYCSWNWEKWVDPCPKLQKWDEIGIFGDFHFFSKVYIRKHYYCKWCTITMDIPGVFE